MAIGAKYQYKSKNMLRDVRTWQERFQDAAKDPQTAATAYAVAAILVMTSALVGIFSDVIFFAACIYFYWLYKRPLSLPFKLPKSAGVKDPNFKKPGGGTGTAEGILYLGNDTDTQQEIWFNNTDARTHILYLGTTGSGKTVGLMALALNTLCWGSGYIYIDGKADTNLWSQVSAHARRFGRDDDLLVMNYMTGNVGGRVPSNTLNPFSSGSASYLTNMLVSLMPDSEGDNAMWKERAVSLVSALMPCLVWKRDNQNVPLSIGVVRTYLTFKAVIKLSRDKALPDHLRQPIRAYLSELPGFVDNVFDDNGDEKPAGPGEGPPDTSTPRQQHGYLSMQFTRSMSSLGDDYGFIFDTQAADVDMLDVVLQRRILIVLIPALEKSGDETANLGKIIASTLKGMMGATLGNTVEGTSETAIENKPTNSSTPFMAIFDEVGYYAAQGMAVMAAQARSLGFSLVFSAQDLPAMEKRVKEEARSITANCNIKLFGKLEDPTQTKEFFEKSVGSVLVAEASGFERNATDMSGGYSASKNASMQSRSRASYDGLKGFNEGKAVCVFGSTLSEIQGYNSDIGFAKAMRVHRFLPIPPPSEDALESLHQIDTVLRRFRNPDWDPAKNAAAENTDINALARGFSEGKKTNLPLLECGAAAVAYVADARGTLKPEEEKTEAPAAALEPAAPATPAREASADATPQERAATTAVATATGTGPLTWDELLGVTAAPKLENAAVPAPVAAAPVAATDPGIMNWGDIIGAAPAAPAAAPAPVATPAPVVAAPVELPKAVGFGWDDIIGSGNPAPQEEKLATITSEKKES